MDAHYRESIIKSIFDSDRQQPCPKCWKLQSQCQQKIMHVFAQTIQSTKQENEDKIQELTKQLDLAKASPSNVPAATVAAPGKQKRGEGGNDLEVRKEIAKLKTTAAKIDALREMKTRWDRLEQQQIRLTEGARSFVPCAKVVLNCLQNHYNGNLNEFQTKFPCLAVRS